MGIAYNACDMPKKKKQQSISLVAVLACICVLAIVSRVLDFLAQNGASALLFCVLALAVLVVTFVLIPRWRQERLFEAVDAKTFQHIDALVRQRVTLIRNDAYGRPILDRWATEVDYFIAHHIRPVLDSHLRSLLDRQREIVRQRIYQRVADVAQQRPAFPTIPAAMTPAEFEAFCAESLRGCGWGVRLTPLSRDQGVDVIAEKNGVRVVLQCKMYSNPVGNKAVQEVAAGRIHQQAHFGAVVTNNTYTTSAKELANTNGIRLLHYTDLSQLEHILGRPGIQ